MAVKNIEKLVDVSIKQFDQLSPAEKRAVVRAFLKRVSMHRLAGLIILAFGELSAAERNQLARTVQRRLNQTKLFDPGEWYAFAAAVVASVTTYAFSKEERT